MIIYIIYVEYGRTNSDIIGAYSTYEKAVDMVRFLKKDKTGSQRIETYIVERELDYNGETQKRASISDQ